jgi:hypothetical protein
MNLESLVQGGSGVGVVAGSEGTTGVSVGGGGVAVGRWMTAVAVGSGVVGDRAAVGAEVVCVQAASHRLRSNNSRRGLSRERVNTRRIIAG